MTEATGHDGFVFPDGSPEETEVWQGYHPDPNTCPSLAVNEGNRLTAFPFSNEPPVRRQYAKVYNWRQNCYLCPYCGTRVEFGAWSCHACRGHFLGQAGTRCLGHALEGRTIPQHILKEAADAP